MVVATLFLSISIPPNRQYFFLGEGLPTVSDGPPSPCPCFSAANLLAINTKYNVTEDSCQDTYEDGSLFELSTYGVIAFSVSRTPSYTAECSSPKKEGLGISESEHDACLELIFERCDAIGLGYLLG